MSLPADFENFWRETAEEAHDAPLDYKVAANPVEEFGSIPSHVIREVSFRGVSGMTLYGWVAEPEGHRDQGFLWLPPYGRWTMKPNEYGIRPGFVSASLNLFGEPATHWEEYTPARGYFAEGIESPQTWIFRRLWMDCVLLGRMMNQEYNLKKENLGAMGLSQGGGLAVWMGAFSGLIGAIVADMPFLGAIDRVLETPARRYPLKELVDWVGTDQVKNQTMLRTLEYFDTANVARFCDVPALITLGLRDPAVRPFQAQAVFDALPGVKNLVELDWGHDWHSSMIERNQAWLEKHLKTSTSQS